MDVKKNIIIISLLWLVVILISFAWNYFGALNTQSRLALFAARSFFEQVIITRQWNARHGGLYVPVTETTRPNPYLDVQDRDLEINPMLELTKVNPAFMTRQLAEIAQEYNGVQFHITSLKPIRPDNKATELETLYLQRFESGVLEEGKFIVEEGKDFFFYMAPLMTEKACLKCHAKQGYKEGDIRGGISVTLPFDADIPLGIILLSHLTIGGAGLFGLLLVGRKLNDSYNVIKRQAIMDALTGIPNRRSFSESILREFNRSRREKEPLSLVMCDIDNFKAYNDSYGHSAGDKCLTMVAGRIKKSLKRPGDFCARYGGEEFVVILGNTSLTGAMKVAERIRVNIENMDIKHSESPPSNVVTISLGVATLSNSSTDSYEELIKYADEALYHSKEYGRNQVQYYQGERRKQ